jgi:kinetochore protein Nuf2
MFEFFAYIIMNTTRDVVSPAMRAAAEELVGPEAERLYTADTRDLMGLFITLRRLLIVVCCYTNLAILIKDWELTGNL